METTYPSAPGDTLVFENDRVRVLSTTLEPGGMFDFHQHHYDHLVLWPDNGQTNGRGTFIGGNSEEQA